MGNTPINIYIDLSKAFDTLDHNILISKLQHYGIKGAALQLPISYLSNRKQFVQYGDTLSQKTDILMGVPQGSILGPLLFIIYINDMAHSSELFKFIHFADDTTLITNLNNEDTRNESLNHELTHFHNWLKANKRSLNINKTKAMVFHIPQKRIQLPSLKIAGEDIAFVDNFNFLGIIINKHLNWTSHVDMLTAKLSKIIGILNTLKHILPINIMRTIYNSLILCHLNYGILPGNYRPISILRSISKIFERIIFNQINDHFTSHDLYYNGQYGFREKHSTQLAALELIDRITRDWTWVIHQ